MLLISSSFCCLHFKLKFLGKHWQYSFENIIPFPLNREYCICCELLFKKKGLNWSGLFQLGMGLCKLTPKTNKPGKWHSYFPWVFLLSDSSDFLFQNKNKEKKNSVHCIFKHKRFSEMVIGDVLASDNFFNMN